MNKNDPRESYWNESYANYWQKRVNESSEDGPSTIHEGDSKTEGDWVYKKLFQDNIFNPGSILDVGCAWGRMFEIYIKNNLEIYGADISEFMIKECKKKWKKKIITENIKETEAENLIFESNFFDNLVCFATFDATDQEKAIKEFFRVLKIDGKLFISGKNHNYFKNDEQALIAEVAARKKGHPNFFTKTKSMIDQIILNNNVLIDQYYFERRGDFEKFNYKKEIPQNFYEYLLIFRKKNNVVTLSSFSNKYSNTFKKMIT